MSEQEIAKSLLEDELHLFPRQVRLQVCSLSDV